jgi:hypothetical protein
MKRKFTTDDRGVSEVIGAILVFGLLIMLMAIMQTQAVPAANQEVEFNHNQDVQSDLVELHATASRVLKDGEQESVRVRMGTTYPSRLIFFSPRNPQGNLRTTDPRPATIDNIQSPDPNVDGYIGSSRSLNVEFRALEYSPGYHEYPDAPTTRYEYGGLYNEFDQGGTEVTSDPGNVIDGREISLVSTAGDFDRTAGGTKSVSVTPAAAPPRTVQITNDSPGPVELTLPTTLSQETWDSLLEGEMVPQGGYVQSYTVDEDAEEIELSLQGGEIYDLTMPRFAVTDSSPGVTPAYVAPSGSGVVRANPGRSVELNAEVRDEHNNPIPDAEVTFDVPGGPTETVRANENGIASFTFTPSGVGNTNVDVTTPAVAGPLGSTSIEVQVGGSVTGPVVMTDSSRTTDEVTYQLENQGGDAVGIERIQLQYAAYGQNELPILGAIGSLAGGETIVNGPTEISEVEFAGGTDSSVGAQQGSQPEQVGISNQLSSGSTTNLVVSLDQSVASDDRLLINVRVFYSGGYSETYALMLTG